MSAWESKVWGQTKLLELNEVSSIHRLDVLAGFRCSKHRHHHRHNGFLVMMGAVRIRWWKLDEDDLSADPEGPTSDRVAILKGGDYYCVPAGIWHRFEVLETGSMVEYYWAELGTKYDVDDIEREDVGGPL